MTQSERANAPDTTEFGDLIINRDMIGSITVYGDGARKVTIIAPDGAVWERYEGIPDELAAQLLQDPRGSFELREMVRGWRIQYQEWNTYDFRVIALDRRRRTITFTKCHQQIGLLTDLPRKVMDQIQSQSGLSWGDVIRIVGNYRSDEQQPLDDQDLGGRILPEHIE